MAANMVCSCSAYHGCRCLSIRHRISLCPLHGVRTSSLPRWDPSTQPASIPHTQDQLPPQAHGLLLTLCCLPRKAASCTASNQILRPFYGSTFCERHKATTPFIWERFYIHVWCWFVSSKFQKDSMDRIATNIFCLQQALSYFMCWVPFKSLGGKTGGASFHRESGQ